MNACNSDQFFQKMTEKFSGFDAGDPGTPERPSIWLMGIGRAHEGIGRHDDLVTRRNIKKQGREFQCRCAGMSQHGLTCASLLTQQLFTFFCERAIADQMARGKTFADKLDFTSR